MSDNVISAWGARRLAVALQRNSTLVSLRLGSNPLATGAAELSEALRVNTALRSLDLGAAEGPAMAAMLMCNSTLTSLDLTYNVFGHVGTAAFRSALLSNNGTLFALPGVNGVNDLPARNRSRHSKVQCSVLPSTDSFFRSTSTLVSSAFVQWLRYWD